MGVKIHRLLVLASVMMMHVWNVFNPAVFYDIAKFKPDLPSSVFVYGVLVLVTQYQTVPEFFQCSPKYVVFLLEVLASVLIVNAALVLVWLPLVAALASEWKNIASIIRVLEVLGLSSCPLYKQMLDAYTSPQGLKLTCVFITLSFACVATHVTSFISSVIPESVLSFPRKQS